MRPFKNVRGVSRSRGDFVKRRYTVSFVVESASEWVKYKKLRRLETPDFGPVLVPGDALIISENVPDPVPEGVVYVRASVVGSGYLPYRKLNGVWTIYRDGEWQNEAGLHVGDEDVHSGVLRPL